MNKNDLNVMFSKSTDNWSTPKNIYDYYINELNCFDLCPLNHDLLEFNGLVIDWQKNNFVNPPYSEISNFVDKAIFESYLGNTTYLLVPSRTDTKWFHKLLVHGVDLHFYKGRLKFGDGKNSAPFPSVLITIKPTDAFI